MAGNGAPDDNPYSPPGAAEMAAASPPALRHRLPDLDTATLQRLAWRDRCVRVLGGCTVFMATVGSLLFGCAASVPAHTLGSLGMLWLIAVGMWVLNLLGAIACFTRPRWGRLAIACQVVMALGGGIACLSEILAPPHPHLDFRAFWVPGCAIFLALTAIALLAAIGTGRLFGRDRIDRLELRDELAWRRSRGIG